MADLIHILAGGARDASGAVLASGVVYIYEVGTTTLATIYSDVALTTTVSNPVTLSAAGKAEIYVDQDVRLVIEDSSGNQIDDIESIGEVESIRGDVTLGSSSTNTISIQGRISTDLDPSTAASRDLGDTSFPWHAIYLDGSTNDGGAVYFDSGTTEFLKSNAAGTILDIGGFTSITGGDVANMIQGWVNFNGTGTVAIRASHNVSSITDGGTGIYTVNWDTDFADANYGVLMWSSLEETRHGGMTSAATSVETSDSSGTLTDAEFVIAIGIGRQDSAN